MLKATYSISLISRDGTVNLSNMPAISEEPYELGKPLPSIFFDIVSDLFIAGSSEKWKITEFDKTPPVVLISYFLFMRLNICVPSRCLPTL